MEDSMYLEVVSASMKSQCYEIPSQASVLLLTSAPGFNFSKQSKSIVHLDASTSKQFWMFKEIFTIPSAMKDQKLHLKLYGSSCATSKASSAETPMESTASGGTTKLKLPKGNTSRLETCVGKADLTLSALLGGSSLTFDLAPVSLVSREEREKNGNLLKQSIQATVTLRLLADPPPLPPRPSELDVVAVREKDSGDEHHDDEVLLGTVRLVVWQGKNLNTEYPVFLHTRMNQRAVRRYTTLPVANPHTPIFDVIQDFDIVSLQGDLFIAVVTDHSLRSNKPLGQVIVPLSVLTKHMGEMETTVTISGWFELFPVNKITKYNGGGKYVPFMKDIPLTSGLENSIGLPLPEKSLGFVKIDVTLQLLQPLLRTLLTSPFCVEEKSQVTSVDEDDTADLFDIYVTKHNFYRIMDALTDPPWFRTFKDIVRWRHHWGVTFFALQLFGYTCLLAPPHLLPALLVVFVVFVGLVASSERDLHQYKLFVDEKEQLNKQQKIEEANSKSLAERYKSMKQSVHKMEQKVRQLASQVEKLNNLLLWSDPTLSLTALFFLLSATLAACVVLSLLPMHLCVFLGGLVVFIPQEAMGRLKKLKRIGGLLLQRIRAEIRSRHDTKLAKGSFLTRLSRERALNGHILSGDLMSQTWSGAAPVPSGIEGGANMNKWTRKWCELWAVPGVLKISDNMFLGEEDKPAELYDVTYVTASYVGKSSRNPPTTVECGSSSSSSSSSSAGGNDCNDDDIFLFEVQYLQGGSKTEALRQTIWPAHRCQGWVFACSSFGDAQTWVKALNKVTYRVSFQSILSGEDFHNPFTKRLNRSLISKVVKTLWRWVMLVPDDIELQHRHFCEQAYVRAAHHYISSTSPSDSTTGLLGRPRGARLLQNNDLDVARVRRRGGHSGAMRYLSVGHVQGYEGAASPAGVDSCRHAGGIHVSLFRARGLNVKSTPAKAKSWLMTSNIPKIYVNLSLTAKEECPLVLRSGGQPRSSEPVFREDFFFPDLDYDALLARAASLLVEVSVRNPMAFGLSSDSVQILGRAVVPLRPWLEQKLTEDMGSGSGSGSGGDAVESSEKGAACLDEEQWFQLKLHTVSGGEVKIQLSCL